MAEKRKTLAGFRRKKQRAVKVPEGTPMPKSAEDLARAIFRQADGKRMSTQG